VSISLFLYNHIVGSCAHLECGWLCVWTQIGSN
jgi:hypothetical protein